MATYDHSGGGGEPGGVGWQILSHRVSGRIIYLVVSTNLGPKGLALTPHICVGSLIVVLVLALLRIVSDVVRRQGIWAMQNS